MPRKKNKLRSTLEKAAKLIDRHFIAATPTVADAKEILQDLRKLTSKRLRKPRTKSSRHAKRK